jgi:xylose isomerase
MNWLGHSELMQWKKLCHVALGLCREINYHVIDLVESSPRSPNEESVPLFVATPLTHLSSHLLEHAVSHACLSCTSARHALGPGRQ